MKILVLADMHVGSRYALCPNWARPNPIQRHINRKWFEMVEEVEHVDYLILNGDLVDGTQRTSEGAECWTTDTQEQAKAAAELIGVIDFSKALVTYGTAYHVKDNPILDAMVADKIGAKSAWEFHFKPEGCKSIFHISHATGVSTSIWQYRTTAIAKELVAALLNESELHPYAGIIRSHAHYYVKVSFSSFGVITPCWQSRTPYMIRKGLQLIPKLGYLTLELEDNPDKESWRCKPSTFNMPRPELTT